ncbi:ferric-chelate reductase [Rhizodiscina lignyota]|uniref:ferric-chelate reductase (NADPH) n=1 Tax=Rhizodiscina lignyota TaxID=1504668 RepID=A0A9P4IBN3_9PEZI|nr:ferric-chelate reductase [Rhizodiscina lignyota]
MNMGDMPMGDGIPSLASFQKHYWVVVGTAIAVATVANILSYVLYRQRLSAASRGILQPAKPKSLFSSGHATLTALIREFSNAALPALSFRGWFLHMPLAGKVSLVIANAVTLLVMCFYGWDSLASLNYEDIGYRTGFVTIMQLPLIFLLAGKNNIVGFLTGFSYEKLNWLHRWTARCMWLTATIHFGYWLADWWPYGDFVSVKIKTDPITWRGLVAWCILGWINLSSSTPIRRWGHEFFVLQHIVSFAVMVGFIYWHVPSENHVWIWIVTAFFWFDRVVRGANVLYHNLSIFHPKQRKQGNMSIWACHAEFTPLPHNTTRITIHNPPISWKAGQHMFLSCHSLVPLQSHPFTAASIPEDGKLEFLVQAQKGATRRFFRHAEKLAQLPTSANGTRVSTTRAVAVEGPYGRMRPLRQFDSVVLFAGSTGATFAIPLLRDIVAAWNSSTEGYPKAGGIFAVPNVAVTRRIRFVWCVKSRGQLGWFASQLATVIEDVEALKRDGVDVEVEMSVYCTCDEKFTEEHNSLLSQWRSSTDAAAQRNGKVEIVQNFDEKAALKGREATSAVREVDSGSESDLKLEEKRQGCGPDGQCCCKATVDEEAITTDGEKNRDNFVCTCCAGDETVTSAREVDGDSTRSGSTVSAVPKFLCHPHIGLFSGRPQTRNIMRKSLEQALGESAVVVCGPRGLIEDVRRNYVAVCDERAVCKGTGAMGVWFHAEGFGY